MTVVYELNAYMWNKERGDYDYTTLYESEDYQQVKRRYDKFILTRDVPQVMLERDDDYEFERLECAALSEDGVRVELD